MSQKARQQRDLLINKTQLASPTASNAGAFRCDLCNASFTSYDAYLDHLHSRLHLKNAGTEQPVERVDDVERIRARLAVLREQRKKGEAAKTLGAEEMAKRVEERLVAARLAEQEKRRQRYEDKKKKKKKETTTEKADDPTPPEDDNDEAATMAAVLGITSFR